MKAEARIAALEAENQQLKARAEKAEHTTDAFIRRLDAEIERCDKAEAALRRQRAYLQHRPDCDLEMWPNGLPCGDPNPASNRTLWQPVDCTCGLAAWLPEDPQAPV